jgi:hypothetical protein
MPVVELGVVDALEIIFYTCTVNGGFVTVGDSWHSSKIIRTDEKNTGII